MNHHFETSQRLQKFLIDIIKSALSSPMTNLVKINTNLDCMFPKKISIKSQVLLLMSGLMKYSIVLRVYIQILNLLQVKKVAVLKTFTYHLN